MNSTYESALGKAIDFARNGYAIPFLLKRELIDDQGMSVEEVLQLEARHQPQNSPH